MKLVHEVEACRTKSEAIALIRQRMKEQTGETPKVQEAEMWLSRNLPLEKEYQKKILARIRKLYPDAFVWKAAAGPYSKGGIPDICCIIRGRFFGFEVKRPILGRPSDLQIKAIADIHRAGGQAWVVSLPSEAEELLAAELS